MTLEANSEISLQLQWFDQFQFAGYYMAKEKGYYKDVGLDVDIKKFKTGMNVTQEVMNGKATFGIGKTSLLTDKSRGNDILLMSAILQSSPLVLVTKKTSGINTIADFKDKKAMLADTKTSAGIFAMLSSQGISRKDMKILKSKNKLQQFLDNKVDIISAYLSNEVHLLRERQIPINVFNPRDFGFDFYSDILFTCKNEYVKNPRLVINFNKASLKGWEYAFSHIGETIKLIEKKYNYLHKTDSELFFEAFKLKELAYRDTDKLGKININKLKEIYNIYRIMGYIKKPLHLNNMILREENNSLHFSNKEKAWIKKHPIVTYSEKNWKPLSIIENGKMKGVFGDFLDLVSKKSGLKFRYIRSNSWDEVIQKFKNRDIDIIPSSPQNINTGMASKVYKIYPMVIVTGDKYKYVSSLKDLIGKSIAVPKYYSSYDYLKRNYPGIKLITTKNIKEALSLVEGGKADAFVGHIATSIYYISTLHLANLKIAGIAKFEFKHSYFVQKKYPLLLSIINKTLSSITQNEKAKIYSKWSSVNKKKVNYEIIVEIILFFVLVLLFLLYRNGRLKKHNQTIGKLKERLELALLGNKDGIWDRNYIEDTLYVSPRWKEMLGYRDDELKNETDAWRKRVHPDDLKKALQDIEDHISGKSEFYENVHRLRHKNGNWIWVLDRGKKIVDASGKIIRMIGTQTDITKEKELHIKLKYQQQILEQIHDCVILTDLQGYIMSWNRGAQLLFGHSSDEIIGKHAGLLYGDENINTVKRFVKILQKRKKFDMELELFKNSKEKIFAENTVTIFRDEKGKAIGIVGYIKDITRRKKVEIELKKQEETLWYQANYDLLTGLPNRALFKDRIMQSIKTSKRHKSKFALLFLDLDRFKQINDSLGHEVGDMILKEVGNIIKFSLRSEDTLVRLGGDEFVIITGSLTDTKNMKVIAQKIINSLKDPIMIDKYKLYISVSIGISLFPDDSTDAHNLLKYADSAMYKAKDEGRNNYQFYSQEMTKQVFERVALETQLRSAIKNREFVVYYQPQVDAVSKNIIGMEGLVRWIHPKKGLISPADFIPIAADMGMIADIDQFVMNEAMSQVKEWRTKGLDPGILALNLSMGYLENKNFIQNIQTNMSQNSLQSKYLELEVTESKVMKKPKEMIEKLKKLNDMSIKIAIDDFGTGYSSLSYLKKLPIDKLKIDKSFVDYIPNSEDDSAIVKAIIALAQSLNLDLIAEGVETTEQKNFLIKNGCINIQGYYYSRPLCSEDMEKLLLNGFG
ncbi:MAG: EAL domain-containing protein [Sulfurospirillum sp.]